MALSLVVASACSKDGGSAAAPAGSDSPDSPPTTVAPTTTAPPPTWPLTGVVGDPAAMNSPIIAVKVDNNPDARPHAGINEADVVYELQVEGITRFMQLFHSSTPEKVGPVRSARSSDIDLFGNLHRPLLVWSGANGGVTRLVQGAANDGLLFDVGHGSAAGKEFYRDQPRLNRGVALEHTLMVNLQAIRSEFTPADFQAPGPIFTFRKADQPVPASAVPTPGMTISFNTASTVRAEYAWDAERGCWDRFQIDGGHGRGNSALVDEAGTQVCPQNVVVLFLNYSPDPIDARSPKADSVGSGDGVVLTNGTSIAIQWTRPTREDPWTFTEAGTSTPVGLTPGKTWFELPKAGVDTADPLNAAAAGELLAARR